MAVHGIRERAGGSVVQVALMSQTDPPPRRRVAIRRVVARRVAIRQVVRRGLLTVAALGTVVVLLLAAGWAGLVAASRGTPSPAARSTGQDALWLGHAWVDGRKTQADVEALAAHLRGTGVRHLYVHTGPLADDGTLDPGLHPRARWAVTSLHAALPGVRVQAWLGDVVGPGRMDLSSPATRERVVASAQQVLAQGFDGIHYDFEPVTDEDPGLLRMLDETRTLTRDRRVLLSVAASELEPVRGAAWLVGALPIPAGVWSAEYLGEVARRVDQVALMAYDSAMPTARSYIGWVRRQAETALGVVPAHVHLLIGAPAYHEETFTHRPSVETVAASLRGTRLALGQKPPRRPFGVALYVDFTATSQDWESYRAGWGQAPG